MIHLNYKFYYKKVVKKTTIINENNIMFDKGINNKYEKTFSKNDFSEIKITDEITKDEQIFFIRKNDWKILNKSTLQEVGYLEAWEDEDDSIPNEFKNNDDIVCNPDTSDELMQYVFNDSELSNLPETIYREYKYMDFISKFHPTNEIEELN